MKPCSVWNLKGSPIPDGYIPAVEAAGFVGLTQSAFYNRVAAGGLPKPLEGQFRRIVGGGNGVPPTAVPVKKVWNREEIEAAAGSLTKHKPVDGFRKKAPMPDGFCRAELAAEFLGMSLNRFRQQVAAGVLPAGTPTCIKNYSKPVNLWKKEALLPFRPKPKPGKPEPADLVLLSRLRCHADKAGFVDGDATDLVTGNPARPADWESINALAKANRLEWGLDNWDRLTFQLAPEKKKPYRKTIREITEGRRSDGNRDQHRRSTGADGIRYGD